MVALKVVLLLCPSSVVPVGAFQGNLFSPDPLQSPLFAFKPGLNPCNSSLLPIPASPWLCTGGKLRQRGWNHRRGRAGRCWGSQAAQSWVILGDYSLFFPCCRNVEAVCRFPELPARRQLSYQAKQLIAREIELEKMRRAEARNLGQVGISRGLAGMCMCRKSSGMGFFF